MTHVVEEDTEFDMVWPIESSQLHPKVCGLNLFYSKNKFKAVVDICLIRSSLIHFACIGVAPPRLLRGSNSNAGKMDQT